MKKILLSLFSILLIDTCFSQYADIGTGNLKNDIWWFDWNNFSISDGASKNFITGDGLNVKITFSNVQGPIFLPSVMNTWYGSVLHNLYNFSNSNIKPALYSPYTTQNTRFTVTLSVTRNGIPAGFKFVAADAEASAINEITTLTTNGSNWQCIDFFRNSSQTSNPMPGCNTTSVKITDTYAGSINLGQNPVMATNSANGSLVVDCFFDRSGIEGQMGIAFGIFSPIDRGDLPASYGYASHGMNFSNVNPCNYLPPLPGLNRSENLKLGLVTGDADGNESLNDNSIGVDEDGVLSFPQYDKSGNYSVQVNLLNTTGNTAYLSGWFDYNRNGIFDINELSTITIPNNATTATLSWTGLPPALATGTTSNWAFRFRLSTNASAIQIATGYAPDGEVEDYIITNLQPAIPDFIVPDTVCINTPVTIVNTSINATTSFWNFCVADINTIPNANNLGNIGGQFGLPVFIDYIQYNGNYYGFLTNNFPGKLTRLDFGNSLLNIPTAVDLGNVGGIIPNGAEGIQMAYNEGRWYAIIVGGNSLSGGSRIVKIDFGPDPTNTSPIGTNWGNIGNMEYPVDLHLFNDNNNWYAFTVDQNSSVYRFSFGSSFNNTPSVTNFGNLGGAINWGNGINVINDNGQWHAFITSRNNSSITRLDFGNSLLNNPTGVNLGNPGNKLNLPRDIYLIKFCNELVAFVVNEGSNDIVKLNFSSVTSLPSAVSLGNIGNLAFPHSISKIFRAGSDLFAFIPNVNNNTLTRISFQGCSDSNIPNYSGNTPPVITYSKPGTYNINLTIDDGLPTQASVCKKIVVIDGPDIDFTHDISPCSPLTISFKAYGKNIQNPSWTFGDGTVALGNIMSEHNYNAEGKYTVSLTAEYNGCFKTITKSIDLSIIKEDIISTADTILCFGGVKQLITKPSLDFCWSPASYLNNPLVANPTTNTPENITYTFTAKVIGQNIINNGDFSQGNTGFSSEYQYANPNVTDGQYYIGTNPKTWNGTLEGCKDHTSGMGNMMMVNGSSIDNAVVWKQTVIVNPNSNYVFSAWIQSLWFPNPAQLQFSINGKNIGSLINASLPSCNWEQFYTTWNSGDNTSAIISIINKNTEWQGNEFAIDDILFAPVHIKRDSVKILVDTPFVRATDDMAVCEGTSIQLNSSGKGTLSWAPSSGLSNSNIANPIATPSISTQYVVTGTISNNCKATDTVTIMVYPKPIINLTNNDTICKNNTIQLSASGGSSYLWTPASGLNNYAIATPIASPTKETTYYVTVTDNNNCTNKDSVKISIYPDPQFFISPDSKICNGESKQLLASGGTDYQWLSEQSLNNLFIANPVANPLQTTTYTVNVTDSRCNNKTTLSTTITVNPRPIVTTSKSNDLDCSNDHAQLTSKGALNYSWSPAESLNNPNISNPIARPLSETTYTVTGTDANGCKDSDTITVKLISGGKGNYLMPNAFTPNNDGLNDCYGIKYWGAIKELEFSIYNRWGERIFYTTDPKNCWDGTYKGVAQNLGTYIYVIKAKTICDNISDKGTFTLIR